MFDQLDYEDFTGVLDSDFQLADANEDIRLRLIEISEKRELPPTVSFALLFKCSVDFVLEQNNYNLKHEKLGEGSLFIVPVRQDGEGVYYEAVFNRHLES